MAEVKTPEQQEVEAREVKIAAKMDRKKKLKEIDLSTISSIAEIKEVIKKIIAELAE